MAFRPFTLHFFDYYTETRYRETRLSKVIKLIRYFVLFGVVAMGIYLLGMSFSKLDHTHNVIMVMFCLFALVASTLFMARFKPYFWRITKILFLLILVTKSMYD